MERNAVKNFCSRIRENSGVLVQSRSSTTSATVVNHRFPPIKILNGIVGRCRVGVQASDWRFVAYRLHSSQVILS